MDFDRKRFKVRVGDPADSAEKELRKRALAEAAQLYRTQGAAAVELLIDAAHDPEASIEDRRRHRLARLEVERLHRAARSRGSNAMVVWKPPLFSLAGLASILGLRRWRR